MPSTNMNKNTEAVGQLKDLTNDIIISLTFLQEYVKGLSSFGMQSKNGFEGQLNACWTPKLSTKELDRIRSAGFLVLVVHGR
jgi:hypothetical protein